MVIEDEKKLKAWEEELLKIEAFLEDEPSDEPNELLSRLGILNVYMARTGRILADAKYYQDKAARDAFEMLAPGIFDKKPTVVSRFIGSLTPKANHVVNFADRLNRACVHASDNMRTQVSFAKEEMRLVNSPYGNR